MSESVYRVDTTSRLAQWRIETLSSCAYRKSDPFKIGLWNWNLAVERNKQLCVKLYPELSSVTRDLPPIASFVIKIISSSAPNHKTLVHSEVCDKQLKNSDDFVWAIDMFFTGRFLIDLEFLDLKTAPLSEEMKSLPVYPKEEAWICEEACYDPHEDFAMFLDEARKHAAETRSRASLEKKVHVEPRKGKKTWKSSLSFLWWEPWKRSKTEQDSGSTSGLAKGGEDLRRSSRLPASASGPLAALFTPKMADEREKYYMCLGRRSHTSSASGPLYLVS